MQSKLGLGCAQFGHIAYGISNKRGVIGRLETADILKFAAANGVHLLDTAPNYAGSESALGQNDLSKFEIVTKTVSHDDLDFVYRRALWSAKRLNPSTILVHNAQALLAPDGRDLWKVLERLKDEGVYKKIGISAYYSDNPLHLAKTFRPDVIQIPVSVFDQRLITDLKEIAALGIEIHARSIFLQGLMFLDKLPEDLAGAKPYFDDFRLSCWEEGISRIGAALGFVLSRPEISKVIVGVTSLVELKEIISASCEQLPIRDWGRFAIKDEHITTPYLWGQKKEGSNLNGNPIEQAA